MNSLSYGRDLQDEYLPGSEIYSIELDDAAEFGSSCYVDLTWPANLLDYAGEACDESDGSLGADAPEGMFLNDHQDEYSAYPVCNLKVLSVVRQLSFNQITAELCSIRPGSIYPPPQY